MALSPTVATTLRLHNPSIAEIADWIPFFNLSLRKIFLTCCQTGLSAKSSHRIEHDLHSAYMKYGPITSLDDRLSLKQLEDMTNALDVSLSSWMTLRSFPSSDFHPDVNYEQLAYMGVMYRGY